MIGFIVLYSKLEKKANINKWKEQFLQNFILSDEITWIGMANRMDGVSALVDDKKFTSFVLLLATGGTEQLAELIIKRFIAPTLIWAHPEKNSLASALEIMGCYQEQYPLSLMYGKVGEPQVINQLHQFVSVSRLIRKMNFGNIGFVGAPSDWLLVSQNTYTIPFNLDFTFMETKEVYQYMQKIDDQMIDPEICKKIPCPGKNDLPREDFLTALKVYEALRYLIEKHHLDAVSLRCFDFLSKKFTACLALSLLNDQGFPAGCEGDKQAVIGLLMAQTLTGKAGWMANPSTANFHDNTITFAHCTIPISMLDPEQSYTFKTHMESNLSVAIEGSLEKKSVTIFRLGGEYDKLLAIKGEIVESNCKNPNLCRTQAKVYIEGHLSEWLDKTCGNHQIIVYGDIMDELKMFCKFYKIDFITIK